jgi:hypothetical protein
LNGNDVSAVNQDDEIASFDVTAAQPLTTTESGGTASFTVVLTCQPTANVTLPVASSDLTEGTVSTASLIFTSANWDTVQTVTVTGVDDAIQDGNISYTIQLGPSTSTDPNYVLDPPNLNATNTDDDTIGIIVDPTSGLVTDEDGGSDTFGVVQMSAPTADVTIPLSSSNVAEGTVAPASLTFTSSNWDTEQTVTVTGVDDMDIDGDIAYTIVTGDPTSTDPLYDAITAADVSDVSVTNLDNDELICGPVEIIITVGAGIVIIGTPGCEIDLYDSLGLLLGSFTIPDNGILETGVIGTTDTHYVVTVAGNPSIILGEYVTVPTLGEWGLIAFVSLLLLAGLVTMRRRQVC